MNDETINRIIDLIEQVGSAAAQEGFALAVRYVRAEAIVGLIFMSAGLIVCGLILRRCFTELFKHDDVVDANTLYLMGALLGTPVTVALTIGLYTNLMRLLVPEWYAVKALAGLLTGG